MIHSFPIASTAARLVKIDKSFNGTLVLDDVSADLFAGEVVGLVGPNGSGKSTLSNILCGALEPDSGEIWVGARQVRFKSMADALVERIRIMPQGNHNYSSLSVTENIFAGQELTKNVPLLQVMDWTRMRHEASVLLQRIGAESVDPLQIMGALSGGQQQAVALARLLAVEADVLVFDEPTTALGVRQKQSLLDIIASQATSGRSVVLISHDIEDVLAVCHRIIALRKGRIVANLARKDFDREKLALLMSVS